MIQLRTGIGRLARNLQIDKMEAAHTGLTRPDLNPILVHPDPAVLTAYASKINAAKTKVNKITELEQQLEQLRPEADNLLAAAREDFVKLGGFVVSKVGNHRELVPPTGYELAAEPASTGPLTKLDNVAANTGDHEGEVDVSWSNDPRADAFEVQMATDPTNGPWQHAAVSGASKTTIGGVPSLSKRWFRVRSVRGQEKGPWSDAAMGTAL